MAVIGNLKTRSPPPDKIVDLHSQGHVPVRKLRSFKMKISYLASPEDDLLIPLTSKSTIALQISREEDILI
jgi:hypothetical protein